MLLVAHPQLAYGLFQSLLLNRIVDAGILQVGWVCYKCYCISLNSSSVKRECWQRLKGDQPVVEVVQYRPRRGHHKLPQ